MNRTLQTLLLSGLLLGSLNLNAAEHDQEAKAPWWDAKWPSRKPIVVDTAAVSQSVSAEVRSGLLLIRLHEGNFNFLASREDGSDLRFLGEDGKTLLPHHIEKWDGLLNEAFVWVKAPDLKPGAKVTLWMYSGNVTDAADAADAEASVDSATTALFHFADAAKLSRNSINDGANLEGTASSGPGIVGSGLRLTGSAALTLPATQGGPWNGALTLSFWFKPTAGSEGSILERKSGNQGLAVGLSSSGPWVEANGSRSSPTAPLTPAVWHHFATVIAEGKVQLFVDGKSAGAINATMGEVQAPLTLGSAVAGRPGVLGEFDELKIATVARGESWVAFEAIAHGSSAEAGKLITLGAEELSDHAEESELAKHLTLLVDISKDLTFDGWVVIVLCALLAVVGMVIAVGKFLYLNAMDKSSKEFLRRWESISSDLTALDSDSDASIQSMGGTLTGKSLRLMKQSPLYRIYHLGSSEIAKRVQASTAEKTAEIATTKRGLSGRSIQAIKATMHGGLMREVERLNSNLVFLTIGIAGGPYLGLLGTVIGVMITFAVIAKSGQVEVNSIAPGIAGALLATVAGLAVAIPCLFVYSYLSTRIKTAVSSMETFIDEFIAKMAEHHKES